LNKVSQESHSATSAPAFITPQPGAAQIAVTTLKEFVEKQDQR
jgi:hypothetical protein